MHGWGRRLGGVFGVSEDRDSLHKVTVFYSFLGKPWNHSMVLKLFEDQKKHHQPSFFFVFWWSCFQTFSDQSQLMADLGPGSTGRMARSMRATITKTWRQHLQHTKSVLFGFQFGLLRFDTPNLWRSVADYGRFFLRLCQSATRRIAYSDNRRKKWWYSNNRNHFCKELQQFWPCQSLMRQDGFGRFRWPSGQSFAARRMEFDAGGEAIGFSCHSCCNTLSWCQCWRVSGCFRIAASHCPQKVPSCAIQNPCHF